ncbi:MAG TPA: hypothetical protein V6D28_08915 [Leptolyngbyaceae cyanobacterium]
MEPISISTALIVKWAVGLVVAAVAVKLTVALIKVWRGLNQCVEEITEEKLAKKIKKGKLDSKIDKITAIIEPLADEVIKSGSQLVKVVVWAEDINGNEAKLGKETISYSSAEYETKKYLDQGQGFEVTWTN